MGIEHNKEAIADWGLWKKRKPEDSQPEKTPNSEKDSDSTEE